MQKIEEITHMVNLKKLVLDHNRIVKLAGLDYLK